jgi:uncharacterized integral membrane protein (TIGR00698 family)
MGLSLPVVSAASEAPTRAPLALRFAAARVPGVLLCLLVAAAALVLQTLEARFFGRAWLEGLVLAILLGAALAAARRPGPALRPGVEFCAKTVLEAAVVLLGAGVSTAALAAAGPALLLGVAAVVLASIAISYALGRAFGLPHCMAALIACGNSICGNSAIAAVAPVIDAEGADVAASISFTAVLGVGVVLALAPLGRALGLTDRAFGVLAGLTVYAVPQVIAAAQPMGALAVQVGALVKLVRVLMLGPVVLLFAIIAERRRPHGACAQTARTPRLRPSLSAFVPWFIVGFLGLTALRALGVVPAFAVQPAADLSGMLTVIAMAALGLGVDVRSVRAAGPRAMIVVSLSLLALGLIALGLIRLLALR